MPRKVFSAGEILTAADVNTNLMDQAVMTFADSAARGSAIASPSEGMVSYLQDTNVVEAYGGTAIGWVHAAAAGTAAYAYVDTVYFTSSGTFTKATYPWLRAIRVKCQGAGGGGGGTTASTAGAGGGGAGGGYAESFITDIAGLSSSETVTIGSGGAGSSLITVAASNGGNTTFGSLVTGDGGTGSTAGGLGATGVGGTGDIVYRSSSGGAGGLNVAAPGGHGGSPHLGGGGRGGRHFNATSALSAGVDGNLYGGAGGGASNSGADANNRSGGTGANGVVIVELYA